jgi:hypothetical protein
MGRKEDQTAGREAEAEWMGGWDRKKKAVGSGEGDGAGRDGELGGGEVQKMDGKNDGTGSGVEGRGDAGEGGLGPG